MRHSFLFLLVFGLATLTAACATSPEYRSFQDIAYPYPAGESVWSKRAQASVYFTQLGQANPKRSSLILLHPWGGNMIIWKDLTEDLSKEHHVVLVDLPGHGKSGKPIGRYPPKRMAYAVMDVIKSLSLTGPILIGNSLGGATAIEVALLAPEKINAIALLGAPGGSQHPQFMRRMVGNLTHPNHIQSVSPHVVHLLWWMVAQTFNPVSAQTVDATWVQTRKSKQWPLFARAVSASLKELLIWNPPVEKISLPALVIQGATDIVVWPWLSDGLGQKIKGSQVARLSACGHFPQLQCLEKLVYVLKPFLARHNLVQRK